MFVSIDRCSGVQCRVGVHPLVRVVVVASEVPASGLTATTFLCARARVLRRLLPQHSGNTLPVRAYFADTAMILLRSSSIADRSRGCLLDGGGWVWGLRALTLKTLVVAALGSRF